MATTLQHLARWALHLRNEDIPVDVLDLDRNRGGKVGHPHRDLEWQGARNAGLEAQTDLEDGRVDDASSSAIAGIERISHATHAITVVILNDKGRGSVEKVENLNAKKSLLALLSTSLGRGHVKADVGPTRRPKLKALVQSRDPDGGSEKRRESRELDRRSRWRDNLLPTRIELDTELEESDLCLKPRVEDHDQNKARQDSSVHRLSSIRSTKQGDGAGNALPLIMLKVQTV